MIDKKLLLALGLTDNEILIYEILLKNGELGINEIVKKSQIVRGSAYHVINSLKAKGLVEESEYRGKKTFIAKNPMILETFIEDKIRDLQIESAKLKANLPKAVEEYLLTSKTPLITSFKGLEGLAKIYEHVLKVRKPLSIFVSHFDRVEKKFSDLINEQIKRQSRAKIKARALSTIKKYSRQYWDFAQKHGVDIRVPKNRANLPAQILVYGDNVAFTAFVGEYISTLVSNPAIAKSMQMIFDGIWKNAQKPIIEDRPMKKKIEV